MANEQITIEGDGFTAQTSEEALETYSGMFDGVEETEPTELPTGRVVEEGPLDVPNVEIWKTYEEHVDEAKEAYADAGVPEDQAVTDMSAIAGLLTGMKAEAMSHDSPSEDEYKEALSGEIHSDFASRDNASEEDYFDGDAYQEAVNTELQ